MRYRYVRVRSTTILTGDRSFATGDLWLSLRGPVALTSLHWTPDVDVYETPTGIAVLAELAGVADEDCSILLFEDALVIEGRRILPACEPAGAYHVAAIRQGPFRIEVPLSSAIDTERVEVQYDRGILAVRLPKIPGGSPR